MYITTGHDDVYAVNAAIGAEEWGYHALKDGILPLSQIPLCCGQANRGVAYGSDKLFLGRLDDVLVALLLLWRFKIKEPLPVLEAGAAGLILH